MAPNGETASRSEKARRASGAHLAHDWGNLEIIQSDLAQLFGERLPQRSRDLQSGFFDRQQFQSGKLAPLRKREPIVKAHARNRRKLT